MNAASQKKRKPCYLHTHDGGTGSTFLSVKISAMLNGEITNCPPPPRAKQNTWNLGCVLHDVFVHVISYTTHKYMHAIRYPFTVVVFFHLLTWLYNSSSAYRSSNISHTKQLILRVQDDSQYIPNIIYRYTKKNIPGIAKTKAWHSDGLGQEA